MLPQSMAPTMRWGDDHWGFKRAPGSHRVSNVATRKSSEIRAFAVWLALWVVLGVVIAVGHVWLGIRVVELGYDRSATRSVIQKLEMEGQSLTAQVETLESPGRLERVARARFDMTRVAPGQQAVLP